MRKTTALLYSELYKATLLFYGLPMATAVDDFRIIFWKRL